MPEDNTHVPPPLQAYGVTVRRWRSSADTSTKPSGGACTVHMQSRSLYAKVLGNVALFGVNSFAHYSAVKNPLGSNGDVGDGQYGRLKQLLRGAAAERQAEDRVDTPTIFTNTRQLRGLSTASGEPSNAGR